MIEKLDYIKEILDSKTKKKQKLNNTQDEYIKESLSHHTEKLNKLHDKINLNKIPSKEEINNLIKTVNDKPKEIEIETKDMLEKMSSHTKYYDQMFSKFDNLLIKLDSTLTRMEYIQSLS